MKVEVSEKFYKDAQQLSSSKTKFRLTEMIDLLEDIQHLKDVPGLKKLKGYKNAYRIRIGDYRMGFIYQNGVIKLSRFLSRKNIYKYFP